MAATRFHIVAGAKKAVFYDVSKVPQVETGAVMSHSAHQIYDFLQQLFFSTGSATC
jgi:hypothetical protein